MNSKKYCILICNSTPYLEPASESLTYNGFNIDQLMSIVVEKNINFSIFSPRKINFLYKLFEKGGGILANALAKNYARDCRHLVLLNGFQLQEKVTSPISQPSSTEQQQTDAKGIKRALSPNSNQVLLNQTQQQQQQSTPPQAQQVQYGHYSKISDQNVQIMQPRVGSPSMNHWAANTNNNKVPSPLQQQMRVRPRPVQQVLQQQATTAMTPNASLNTNIRSPTVMNQNNNVPTMARTATPSPVTTGIRPQSSNLQLPFNASPHQAAPSPSQSQPSPMGMRAVMSPMSQPNSVPSPLSQTQPQPQFNSPQQITQSNSSQTPVNQTGTINQMQTQGQQQQTTPQQQHPSVGNNIRTKIWNGTIEYVDKQQRITYSLDCSITYQPNSNEPEFKAERWMDKLVMSSWPRTLMNRLSPIFKNSSYQVYFHFQESPGLQVLCKALATASVN